ncbi:MAG: hypothetical protein HC860_03225 [Alkalinema sp. RU_4_3]|nr:hypothetical protein [Alkalinema sp. RU_4_3]
MDTSDLSRFTDLGELEANLHLYTARVWHVTLKRQIRLVCLVDQRRLGKRGVALLFSTDVELDANALLTYYQARFQIEISQPQCPHKSEAAENEAVSIPTVFWTSRHSLGQFREIRTAYLQLVG